MSKWLDGLRNRARRVYDFHMDPRAVFVPNLGTVDRSKDFVSPQPVEVVGEVTTSGELKASTGYVQASVAGTGGNITKDLDTGSDKKRFLWVTVFADDGVNTVPIDKNVTLYASDQNETRTTRIISHIPSAIGALVPIQVFDVRKSVVTVGVESSTLGTSYTVAGFWIEDR